MNPLVFTGYNLPRPSEGLVLGYEDKGYARSSWWIGAKPDGFTALAWQQWPRMRKSEYGSTLAKPLIGKDTEKVDRV